jgi:flagellar protein FliO/FliZ
LDLIDFSRYFAALLVVLGLLGGFALLARRGWIPGGIQGLARFSSLTGARAERRLSVKETLILDPRRRVVVVKVDGEEHVLLLGPEREMLLSTRPARPEAVFEPIAPDAEMGAGADSAPDNAPDSAAARAHAAE